VKVPAHVREQLKRRPALRRKLEHRIEAKTGSLTRRLMAYLFPAQRAFVESTSKRKAALCSRRAGKTFGIAAWLYMGALGAPGGLSVYITTALPQARRNLMPALERINREVGLGMRQRTIDGQLICELPNGHRIWIAGCDNRAECEKFRGAGDGYTRAVVDEAGSGSIPGYLEYLVDEILDPALLDQQGDLALTGSPGIVCAGLFYSATTGDGAQKWETFEWTLLDNPHLPDPREFLEKKKRDKGWTDETPVYRREYLGKWVRDNSILALPFDWQKNTIEEMPDYDGRVVDYYLGVDVGVGEAPSAFVVLSNPRGLPDMFVLRAYKRTGLEPSAMAAEVKRLQQDFRFRNMVVDTGGLGAGYAAEMVARHHLMVEAAKKTDKRTAIEVARGELMSGNLRIVSRHCRDLVDEIRELPLNEKGDNFDGDHFACHAADALVYVVRACRPNYNEAEERRALTPEEYNERHMREYKKGLEKTAIANAKRTAQKRAKMGLY
jgi:hypothetical protein